MRVAFISAFAKYSVGKIMIDLAEKVNTVSNCEAKIFYARDFCTNDNISKNIGNKLNINMNALLARIFDNDGFCIFSTIRKLIKELEIFKPDVVHLHCLHGYYMNVDQLFKYLKEKNIKVIWTMHDCWAITGHCCYFEMAGCYKRMTGCYKCDHKREYPKSLIFDNSKRNYIKKKKIFTSLKRNQMTLVTPSIWLKDVIAKSYLNKYEVKVINNDINNNVFNEIPSTSKIYLIKGKYMLGVASVWDKRKGLKYFLKACEDLPKDWSAVIIGKIEEQVILPPNVFCIERTDDQEQLKSYYQNCAFVFNPTLDENYPTVNIEAQACGAKVITFDSGGSLETNIGSLYVADKKHKITFSYLKYILSLESRLPIRLELNQMTNTYFKLYEETLNNESFDKKKN